MCLPIGDVVELVGPDRAVRLRLGQRFGEAGGIFHVVVGVLVRDGGHFHEFRTEQPQRVLLLLRLRLGNHDDRAIAHRGGDHRDADAGIAGCALDDGAAGAQLAFRNRVPDDEQGGPILDRLARIHEFGLAENGAPRLFRGALQLDQGRVTDGCGDAGGDLQRAPPGWSCNLIVQSISKN